MKKLLSVALVLTVAASVQAEDKKPAKKKPARGAGARVFNLPKSITLNEEQQKKLAAIKEEYTPKLRELNKARREAVGADKLKARRQAMMKARKEGLKGKELNEAANKGANFSEEEQKKWDDIAAKNAALTKEIRGKIKGLLTDEQAAKLPGGKKKGKGKKKKKAEDGAK